MSKDDVEKKIKDNITGTVIDIMVGNVFSHDVDLTRDEYVNYLKEEINRGEEVTIDFGNGTEIKYKGGELVK